MIAELLSRARSVWWNLARRDRVEQGLSAELESYVDLLAAERERHGASPDAARRDARITLGGMDAVKESTRDAWVGNWIALLAREVKHAVSSLMRSPGYLITSVVTLAIGIGGACAVFSVMDAVLFRPLAGVREPERLVSIERLEGDTTVLPTFGYPDYLELRRQTRALSGVFAYTGRAMTLNDRAGSTRAAVHGVTGNFFDVLGVRPALGRMLDSADVTSVGSSPVAVISDGMWRRRFGADSSIVGSTLRLSDAVFTIVGVAPPGFAGTEMLRSVDMWVPLTMMLSATHGLRDAIMESRSAGWLRVVGRLAPGKTVADAQRNLSFVAARLAAAYPTNKGRAVRVSANAGMLPDERADSLRLPRLLAAAVLVLLLIACGNVATLALIRGAARRRELATRLALGASRASVARRSAIEGVCIAGGATVFGFLFANLLLHSAVAVKSLGAAPLDVTLDRRVLAAGIGLSVLTAVLVSFMPALQSSRTDLAELIKDGAGGAVRRRGTGQQALVAMQIALSLVLLSCAATLDRAFRRIINAGPGFESVGLSYANVGLRESGYDDAKRRAVLRAVLARAATDPSFTGAALTSTIPPEEWSTRVSVFRRGEEPSPSELAGREFQLGLRSYVDAVSPNYFTVMRTRVVLGRAFTSLDDEAHPPVVIVSRRLADMLWPHQNPVGQFLAWPIPGEPPRAPFEVVGVAADTRHSSLTAGPPPLMYVPIAQQPLDAYLVVRGRDDVAPNPRLLRDIIASVDGRIVVTSTGTLDDHVRADLSAQRTASAWLLVFGAIALVLAAIGLYGIVAQTVAQRTRELAVRAAIGAMPRQIFALVVGNAFVVVIVGAAIGLLLTLASVRVVQSSLMPVDASDLLATAAAAVVLAATALGAAGTAARRTIRLDPTIALRSDS